MDVFARKIVGWRVSISMITGFVLDARIHHSDRVSQYLSIRYTERLAGAGIDPSVGNGGVSYEFKLVRTSRLNDPVDHSKVQNVLGESTIGLLKAEVIKFPGPWNAALGSPSAKLSGLP